jgi:hypothetical protein
MSTSVKDNRTKPPMSGNVVSCNGRWPVEELRLPSAILYISRIIFDTVEKEATHVSTGGMP